MKDEPDVVIAKMDATANEVPKLYDIKAFPTFYWVPKNEKASPQLYENELGLKSFLKFIAANATHALYKYDREGQRYVAGTTINVE